MWADLLPVGRDPGTGGYRRFAWSAPDLTCREWFAAEAARRGLDLVVDRNGNQWAWWGDPDATAGRGHRQPPRLGAGRRCVRRSARRRVGASPRSTCCAPAAWSPAQPVGVVAFTDEEGARFGIACTGSRLLTGVLDPDRARNLTDADGSTLARAMARAGVSPDRSARTPRRCAGSGASSSCTSSRAAAWATTRRSASRPASGRTAAGASTWPVRPTTRAPPGSRTATTRCCGWPQRCSRRERPPPSTTPWPRSAGSPSSRTAPTRCRPRYQAGSTPGDPPKPRSARSSPSVAAAAAVEPVEESWTPEVRLPGRAARPDRRRTRRRTRAARPAAGHDAGILADAGVPSAMLFVRNPTGVSHSPAEYAEPADCHAGVAALVTVLADLACGPGRPVTTYGRTSPGCRRGGWPATSRWWMADGRYHRHRRRARAPAQR